MYNTVLRQSYVLQSDPPSKPTTCLPGITDQIPCASLHIPVTIL